MKLLASELVAVELLASELAAAGVVFRDLVPVCSFLLK